MRLKKIIISNPVAHELGHGQFLLKHPFDNSYKLLQNGLPENLMDYGNGTHLAKWQWDIIKSPGVVNRVFEREGDAMMVFVFSDDELQMIQKTLKSEERKYVKKDSRGFIDEAEMKRGLEELSKVGDNYSALYILVKSDEITEVKIKDSIIYMDYSGSITSDPFPKTKKLLDDIWIQQKGNNDFTGSVTLFDGKEYTYEEFIKYWNGIGLENTEEEPQGIIGISLYSIEYKPNPDYPYYSTNKNNQVFINVHLTKEKQSVLFAHEAYGHVLFKLLKKNHSHGQGRTSEHEDYNQELEEQIKNRENGNY